MEQKYRMKKQINMRYRASNNNINNNQLRVRLTEEKLLEKCVRNMQILVERLET